MGLRALAVLALLLTAPLAGCVEVKRNTACMPLEVEATPDLRGIGEKVIVTVRFRNCGADEVRLLPYAACYDGVGIDAWLMLGQERWFLLPNGELSASTACSASRLPERGAPRIVLSGERMERILAWNGRLPEGAGATNRSADSNASGASGAYEIQASARASSGEQWMAQTSVSLIPTVDGRPCGRLSIEPWGPGYLGPRDLRMQAGTNRSITVRFENCGTAAIELSPGGRCNQDFLPVTIGRNDSSGFLSGGSAELGPISGRTRVWVCTRIDTPPRAVAPGEIVEVTTVWNGTLFQPCNVCSTALGIAPAPPGNYTIKVEQAGTGGPWTASASVEVEPGGFVRPWRTLDFGAPTGSPEPEGLREISSELEWQAFWREHFSDERSTQTTTPFVAFPDERVVVVTGADDRTCASFFVSDVQRGPDGTTIFLSAGSGSYCVTPDGRDYEIIAVANDGTPLAHHWAWAG